MRLKKCKNKLLSLFQESLLASQGGIELKNPDNPTPYHFYYRGPVLCFWGQDFYIDMKNIWCTLATSDCQLIIPGLYVQELYIFSP